MTRKYGEELSRLVINNMNVVQIAPKVVEEIEVKVLTGLNDICKVFAEQQGFHGQFDMGSKSDEAEIEFYQNSDYWKNGDDIICSYYLDSEENENDDMYWLTDLLGVYNNAHSTFAYRIDYTKLKDIKLKEYRHNLAVHYDNNQLLKELGFRVGGNGQYIYLPFKLDQQILSDEYPDELDTVYDVVRDSLEKIKKAHNVFNKITQDIVKKAGYK